MTENTDQEAVNQMIQGKRHLLIKDYYSAVQSFEKVCQLLAAKYGNCADECGDAYLNYGISLLELARQETGANEGLVNAQIQDPSGSENDDDDEDEDGEGEAEEEGDEGEENAGKTDDEGKKTDAEEDLAVSDQEQDKEGQQASEVLMNGEAQSSESKDTEMADSEAQKPETNGQKVESNGITEKNEIAPVDDPQPSSSSAGPSGTDNDLNEPSTSSGIKKSDDDDEPSNTEIAWEVLSIAKEIFTRQVSKGQDVKFKLAETLQKLGEIAIEWENNELAIDMLTECLNLREQSLPEDDRLIAETHYHIGNAHSLIAQMEQANECFQKAVDVIKKRIENKKVALTVPDQNEETLSNIKEEIQELENLLPDMVSRIEDRSDQMIATIKDAIKMAVSDQEEIERAAKLKTNEPKPVNDITHLVKRKRVDGDSKETNGSSKKICTNEHQPKEVKNDSTVE